ncbi:MULTISPECIES: MFS transporter [Sphingobium]|uniref:MFS transporter n=1 Tax=Sphingobium TaxID=165695 RepID=UPI0015EC454B|nr:MULTISPECIES: MFS transporter [Sphingobium]MCW2364068.1 MFS family permease [Sphingobium sp. B10D3B]MCW2402535.1 MFS family permease [Sphingobium sp. B10D7B]MCW2409514.1 MFS family permease [Sphingobium xanthum]
MSSGGTFSPLRHRTFLLILLGSLFSHFGNAIQSVGAAWQLTITGQPADVIALVQSATNLPIMLLALPAGAWADMFDKRLVMLGAQTGMVSLSILLAALAFVGTTPPGLLIGLTALLACGVACFNPALASSIGSIVPRSELAAGVALNILAFNIARSLGPAIGGGIVALGGAKAAFVVNALSYLMVIVILLRWRTAPPAPATRRPLLTVIGEGFRFALGSPAIRTVLVRAISFTLAGSAAWALMPLVATQMLGRGSMTFGLLLGALGLGAVIGAASSTWFRQRFSSEAIIRGAGLLYGAVCVCVALGIGLVPTLVLLVLGGAGWVQALSGFAVAGQMWSPAPLIGRITAMVSSLTFGGIALGSWLWGHVAQAHGVASALLFSGLAMLVLPFIGLIWPMPRHEGAKPA